MTTATPAVASEVQLFPIPAKEKLYTAGASLVSAPELDEIVNRLLQSMPEHEWLRDYKIRCLWKCGEPKWIGHATSKGEEDVLLSGVHLTIKVASERVRTWITHHQMEALIYHELEHFEEETNENTGKTTIKVRDHDVEEFFAVVHRYGDWRNQISQFNKQLKLFGDSA